MQAQTAVQPRARGRDPWNPRIEVYSPVTRPRDVECFGTLYHFPPRGIAQCICAEHVASGDVEGVHDAFEYERDDMNRILTQHPKKVTFTALQVARHICGPDLMGGLGFVMLAGSMEEQEAQKRQADLRYAEFRSSEVEEIIADWEARCAEYSRIRPGQAPPRRPKNVADAYKDRELMERGANEGRADYICPTCSEETTTREAMDAHMALRHPGLVGVSPITAPAVRAPDEAAPEPIQRVQTSLVASGKRYVELAGKAGLPLSVADRKGLEHGDPDVIADIVVRLAGMRQEDGAPAEPLQPEPPDPDPPETAAAQGKEPPKPKGGGQKARAPRLSEAAAATTPEEKEPQPDPVAAS